MLAKALSVRADVFLYILGGLLACSIFTGCGIQNKPPVPYVEKFELSETPLVDQTPVQKPVVIPPVINSKNSINIEITGDDETAQDARNLYAVMKVAIESMQDSKQESTIKNGIDYSCSVSEKKASCLIVLDTTTGAVVSSGKKYTEAPAQLDLKEKFNSKSLYMDRSEKNWANFKVSPEQSKIIYQGLTRPEEAQQDAAYSSQYKKFGERVTCFRQTFKAIEIKGVNPLPSVEEFVCYIAIQPDHAYIEKTPPFAPKN